MKNKLTFQCFQCLLSLTSLSANITTNYVTKQLFVKQFLKHKLQINKLRFSLKSLSTKPFSYGGENPSHTCREAKTAKVSPLVMLVTFPSLACGNNTKWLQVNIYLSTSLLNQNN